MLACTHTVHIHEVLATLKTLLCAFSLQLQAFNGGVTLDPHAGSERKCWGKQLQMEVFFLILINQLINVGDFNLNIIAVRC